MDTDDENLGSFAEVVRGKKQITGSKTVPCIVVPAFAGLLFRP